MVRLESICVGYYTELARRKLMRLERLFGSFEGVTLSLRLCRKHLTQLLSKFPICLAGVIFKAFMKG